MKDSGRTWARKQIEREEIKVVDYWENLYEKQRLMEKKTPWTYCPWCGRKLVITQDDHICDYPDID